MRPTRRDVADITDGAPTRARRADRRFSAVVARMARWLASTVSAS
jgi:hypothetical protein